MVLTAAIISMNTGADVELQRFRNSVQESVGHTSLLCTAVEDYIAVTNDHICLQ